jgi:quercetin dioxygenase-like cupin family protein
MEVYRWKLLEVKDVSIKWLTQAGPEDSPEYGLRFFTVGPGGEIPIHNHFYIQTMYIMSGHLSVCSYDGETDETKEEKIAGPNDVVFIPSMEPHSAKNTNDTANATFLCCIGSIYDKDI